MIHTLSKKNNPETFKEQKIELGRWSYQFRGVNLVSNEFVGDVIVKTLIGFRRKL